MISDTEKNNAKKEKSIYNETRQNDAIYFKLYMYIKHKDKETHWRMVMNISSYCRLETLQIMLTFIFCLKILNIIYKTGKK